MSGLLLSVLLASAVDTACGSVEIDALEPSVALAVSAGLEDYAAAGEAPDAAGKLGMLLHANGLTAAAAPCYRRIGLAEPGEPRWAHLAGIAAEVEGWSEAARGHYWSALRAAPGYAPAAIRLATLLRAEGAIEEAGIVLERFAQDGAPPAVLAALAEQALAEERHERAEALLRAVLDEEPEADRFYYLLGRALQAQGKNEEAREALAKRGAVGLAPADPFLAQVDELQASEATALLEGRRAFQAGQYEEASVAFAKALDRNPASIPARVNLATALGQLGRLDDARVLYEETLELMPENRAALFNLAVFDESAAPEAAIARYQLLADLDPTDAEVQYRLGLLHANLGQIEEALAALNLARGDLGYFADASLLSVRILLATGDEAGALELLKEARAVAPRDPSLVSTIIALWTTANDLAVRDGVAALELARERFGAISDSEGAFLVAQAHAELNECEEARAWLRRASELSEASDVAAQLLATSESITAPCRRLPDPS